MDMAEVDQVSAVAAVVEPSAAAGEDAEGAMETDEVLEAAIDDAEARADAEDALAEE
jgi:hypothetical protein